MSVAGTGANDKEVDKKKLPAEAARRPGGSRTTLIAVSAVLAALGIMLSALQGILVIPIGDAKVFPAQSMINVVAGVMVGPWYGAVVALTISIVRFGLGWGTIFAFPGSIPGVILVGLAYRYLWKNPAVGFIEILGTGIIGAALSSFIFAPLISKSISLPIFIAAFIPPSVIGSILGFLMLLAIKATVRKRVGLQFP